MRFIHIDGQSQKMFVYANDRLIFDFSISTAANGFGEQQDSGKTPRGWHQVVDKIGERYPFNTVFIGRKATGEIYHNALAQRYPHRDWILTRIIRISGLEPNRNLGGDVDSYQRYIYLHGTPDSTKLGREGSKGCIRMANQDIVQLFDAVSPQDLIYIEA